MATLKIAAKGMLSLPNELLAHICAFLQPRDLLSFALSCRATGNGASDALRNLQNIFFEYKVICDEDPLTLLTKLRAILSNPFRAQCVRRLEFRDMTSSWADWRPNRTPTEDTESQGDAASENLVREIDVVWGSYYSYEELELYRKLLRTHIFRSFTANTLSNAHISMLRDGQDDALKLLLIALCPKLESLTFYAFGPSNPDRPRQCPHPLFYSFLAHDQAVHQIFNHETRLATLQSPHDGPWPPGFQALRSVSVCAPAPTSSVSEPYHTRPANVSGLFWLPNIETLELYNLRHRRDNDQWVDVNIGCSTVQNLKFESCQIKLVTMLRFITASKGLRQLSIKRSGRNIGFVGDWVGYWYAESLGK